MREQFQQYFACVEAEAAGERLDIWLSRCCNISRNKVQRALSEERVQCGDHVIKHGRHRIKAAESYALQVPIERAEHLGAQPMALDICYEDDDVLVLNKPVGLVVHPGAGHREHTLINGLLAHVRGDAGKLSKIGGASRPGIVHRLDKDTSGLLLVAKNDYSHVKLQEQFQKRTIERCYHALVWGEIQPSHGEIDMHIMRHPRHHQKMLATRSTKGRYALTHYRTLQQFVEHARVQATLIECRLATGRTHQIRVHCLHQGNPLVGDPLYGRRRHAGKSTFKSHLVAFPRQALHAKTLGFVHPRTGKALMFDSPLADDFAHLLLTLEAAQPGTQTAIIAT